MPVHEPGEVGQTVGDEIQEDTNLGGAGNTILNKESKQSVEGEVRNPRQMITK